MKLKVFAVYDSKSENFGTPMFMLTEGVATRSFEDECNRKESQLYQHPEDYGLFHIADYEDQSGVITPLKQPKSLGMAIEYKKSEN